MNNKGQTLVLFLILLPILLILFISIYQIATMGLEKRKIEDSVIESLEYGVNNINNIDFKKRIKEIIITENPSIKNEDIIINISNKQITLTVTKKYTISFIIEQELRVSYIGRLVDNKVEIIENRG